MSKVKILLVEDEADVAGGIRDILEDKGYSVTDVVDSGEEAIKKAGQTRPDLVLMDIILKGDIDGIKAAKQIHSRFNIPVIYLTGYADEEKLQQAKLTEPYGYILKPFNAQELHATIEMAFYKRKLENELKSRFSTVLRSIGDAVITTDRKGFITFMNPVAEALTGWKKEVAQGKALTEVFDVKDKDKIISIKSSSIKSLFKGDIDNISCDSMLINKEKTDIPVEFNIAPIRDDKEIITGFVLLFHDITERLSAEQAGKKAEDALQIERNNLRNIINSMEDGVYIVNRRYDIQFVNPVLVKNFGPYEGIKCYKYFHDRDEICPWCKNKDVWAGKTVRWEWYSFKNEKTYDLIDTPLTLPDGSIGKLEIFRDITERKRAEEKLKESEQKYRALFEGSPDGIIVANVENGQYIQVNPAVCKKLGYSEKEIKDISQFKGIHPKEEEERIKDLFFRQAKGEIDIAEDIPFVKKDGTIRYFDVNSVGMEVNGVHCVVGLLRDITERKKAEEEATKYRKELQRLSAQLINAQETERKKISRELHDELGQALTAIAINLSTIDNALPPDCGADIKERFKETSSLVDQVSEQMHDLALELRPSMLDDLGLIPTLRWYVNRFSKRLNIDTELKTINLKKRLTPEVETALYRIVQEALTNTVRHAQAQNVNVLINRKKSVIEASIEDNGEGFNIEGKSKGSKARIYGAGLLGIRERVTSLGGNFSIQSHPGEGTRLFIKIPLGSE